VGLGLGLGVECGDEEVASPVIESGAPLLVTLPTVGKARAGSACHCLWICCDVSRNLAPCNINVTLLLTELRLCSLEMSAGHRGGFGYPFPFLSFPPPPPPPPILSLILLLIPRLANESAIWSHAECMDCWIFRGHYSIIRLKCFCKVFI
jgi:hypothetical protein